MTEIHTPQKVLVVFAHPDDAEFFCGGTLAKWAANGAEITLLLATSGDKGSSDPDMTSERLAALREEEARQAAKVIGMKQVIFLRYPDGELTPSLELRRHITRHIRLLQPDTLVTNDPTAFWYGTGYINHPDHRAVADATLAAVYPTARDRLNFIEHERDEGLAPHKVKRLYIAIPSEPTITVDITDYLDTKIRALGEHKTQVTVNDESVERMRKRYLDSDSPENEPRYVERFRVMALA